MPNLAIGLCIGLSAWTICMGSTALSVGSGPKETKILPSFRTTSFTDSKDVKRGNKELPCIGSLFGEIEWNTSSSEMSALENKNVEGCLAVWWERETYDGGIWRGSWNLLLGMKDDKYGVIFSQSVEANDGKLTLDSSFYNLNKKDKWLLVTSDIYAAEEIEKGKVVEKMLLPNDEAIRNKWTFNFDIGEICSSTNSCVSDSPENQHLSSIWTFVSDSGGWGVDLVYKWFKDAEKLSCCGDTIKLRLQKIKGSFELVS